jgi:hypothetical protein
MIRINYNIADREFGSASPGDIPLDTKLTANETITIGFEYPLSTPVQRQFHHAGGFTVADFAAAVAEGYEQIYAQEEVHGIWGHGIGDLVLECILPPAARDGVWQLFVGS